MGGVEMIEDEKPYDFGAGHNSGAVPMREMALEEGARALAVYEDRRDQFLRSAANATVRDRGTAGSAGDVVKLARQVWDKIEAERLERSNPYRDTASALAQQAIDFWADVDTAMTRLRMMIDNFMDAEAERIAAQEREQAEAMKAMRAAAQPAAPAPDPEPGRAYVNYSAPTPAPAPNVPLPAKPAPIRGDYGARISTKQHDDYEIEDVRALPDHILNAPVIHEAILALVRSTAKKMGVPKGIRVSSSTRNSIS